MIKIVIVNGFALIRKSLDALLVSENGFQIVGEANNGEEAIQKLKLLHPDIVLMDFQMVIENGIEVSRKIMRLYPSVKILILTSHDSDLYPERLLKEGVVGYVTYNDSPEELIQAIHSVARGEHYLCAAIAQRLAIKRCMDTFRVTPAENLSRRELQVMTMIALGKRTAEVAEFLHLSHKTINTYRYRLYDKLSVRSDVALTHLALQYRIIMSESVIPRPVVKPRGDGPRDPPMCADLDSAIKVTE
jgi:two-component system invasion response regulator UvrY